MFLQTGFICDPIQSESFSCRIILHGVRQASPLAWPMWPPLAPATPPELPRAPGARSVCPIQTERQELEEALKASQAREEATSARLAETLGELHVI